MWWWNGFVRGRVVCDFFRQIVKPSVKTAGEAGKVLIRPMKRSFISVNVCDDPFLLSIYKHET